MSEKKTRSKHIGYNAQREQCRLNKYTYIENISSLGGSIKMPVLFCNYPFSQPEHKKGLCKASTCTDMREIPDDVVLADSKIEVPQDGKNTPGDTTAINTTEMPCPRNE